MNGSQSIANLNIDKMASSSVTASAPAAVSAEEVAKTVTIDMIVNKVQTVQTVAKELINLIKILGRDHNKLLKDSSSPKKKGKKSSTSGEKTQRAASGFAKPTPLSDEMCNFLNVPAGTDMARTEVTRRINDYIKEHNLQDSENKRKINPDAKLSALIVAPDEDKPLTYFNLQACIKHHFLKTRESS